MTLPYAKYTPENCKLRFDLHYVEDGERLPLQEKPSNSIYRRGTISATGRKCISWRLCERI
jgi:hypothetical protein